MLKKRHIEDSDFLKCFVNNVREQFKQNSSLCVVMMLINMFWQHCFEKTKCKLNRIDDVIRDVFSNQEFLENWITQFE